MSDRPMRVRGAAFAEVLEASTVTLPRAEYLSLLREIERLKRQLQDAELQRDRETQ